MRVPALSWCLMAASLIMPLRAAGAEPSTTTRVLVIHQYSMDMPFRAEFDPALQKALRASISGRLEIYSEALETYRFPSAEHGQLMRRYLREKYEGRHLDVIITVYEAALEFVRANKEALFTGVPVVALTTQRIDRGANENLTGIWVGSDLVETAHLALALHSHARHVFVVGSAFRNSGARQEGVTSLRESEPQVSIEYLKDRSLGEVTATLANAPRDSVVLYLRQLIGSDGETIDQMQGLTRIAASAALPVYGTSQSMVGSGLIGGYVSSIEANAAKIAALAARVSSGISASTIPAASGVLVPVFDWRELRRWDIDEHRLPPGSRVLFRESTFWNSYRSYVLGAGAIFGAEGLLIGALLVQRRRRRGAESALLHSRQRYAMATSACAAGVWDWNPITSELYIDPGFMTLLGSDDPPPNRLEGLMRFMHPQDRAAAEANANACAMSRDAIYAQEHRMICRDGSVRWFQYRGTVMESDGDKPSRVLGTFWDVTDRKDAEAALRASESALRARHSDIQDLAGRLIAAQEVERVRIARDLHDDLSQRLALLSNDIDQLGRQTDLPHEATEHLQEISRSAAEIASDVHELSRQLHPTKLETLGLVTAIQSVCREVSNQHRIAVEFRHEQVPPGVASEVALCLYRIVQESLRNVVKHSGATRALVRVTGTDGELELHVADPGKGFDVETIARNGLGLVSMRERVNFVGGEIVVHSRPGGGTRIGVRVPSAGVRTRAESA